LNAVNFVTFSDTAVFPDILIKRIFYAFIQPGFPKMTAEVLEPLVYRRTAGGL
jgi:hypothetical protein